MSNTDTKPVSATDSMTAKEAVQALDRINVRYASILANKSILKSDLLDDLVTLMKKNNEHIDALMPDIGYHNVTLNRIAPESIVRAEKLPEDISEEDFLSIVIDTEMKLREVLDDYQAVLSKSPLATFDDKGGYSPYIRDHVNIIRSCKFTVQKYV